ncbi:ABC transporter ATP-binding protein [Zestomonas carbonaria]|uniref:Osmoprotectant import ATP-binding protein OsmV n=1 Tax=Zestomonas carbonaria TaxID=2762745 RepID=A0A7U7EPB2_9GAMM|nr:ABC transporter ATP-binding protein [Pseudomonas carbonaria]CAD5108268.1 Osmoprotectant import ATP-binding protein OsmV [Pseudomonas carbonaria]
MIKLEHLTKIFHTQEGEVIAADHIDMEVPQGEICVLLGPSGCGKTTTLKMINRIVPATSGRVFIGGEDTSALDTITLRRNIGYVIQQIGLFPNMTIEENICVVPKLLGWDKARYLARAAELLAMVALEPRTFLKRYPRELSGGQQQRVGVIRALAADPPVMLLDEPFGAIDPINREIIQDEFLKMQQELKKTILFVSHDIDEAVKMADRIAIFDAGKLVQFASPDHVLAHPANKFVEDFVGSDRTLKRLRLVKVKDVMMASGPTVRPEDDLKHALRLMESRDHMAITMVDRNGRPIGSVYRSLALAKQGTCGDHHYGLRAIVNIDDDLRTVAALMFRHDTTWIPCVDDQGVFRGEVSQRGVTHYLGATYRRVEDAPEAHPHPATLESQENRSAHCD